MLTVTRSERAKTRYGARTPMSRMAESFKAVGPTKGWESLSRSPRLGSLAAGASRARDGSGVGLGGSAGGISCVMSVLPCPGAADAQELWQIMRPARALLQEVTA